MKKQLFQTVIITLFFFPSIGQSNHLLHFTNGDSVSVSRYWGVGTDIAFEHLGGTIQIPTYCIRHISDITVHPCRKMPELLLPGPPHFLSVRMKTRKEVFRKAASILPINLEAYRQEVELEEKLLRQLERFRRASKHRDQVEKTGTVKTLIQTSAQLSRSRLKRTQDCVTPKKLDGPEG